MNPEQIVEQRRLRAAEGDPLTEMVTPVEVASWPPGTLHTLLHDGVIERDQPELLVQCPECDEHWEPVQWLAARTVIVCPEAGLVAVEPAAMERWRVRPSPSMDRPVVEETAGRNGDDEPAYLFRRCGDYWDLRFASSPMLHLKHSKGLNDISLLLRSPREFISAAVLMQAAGSPSSTVSMADDGLAVDQGRGLPLADEQAIRAVSAELALVEDELAEAKRAGQPDAWIDLEDRRDKLKGYLGSGSDRRGSPRATGGNAGNARTAVTKRVDAAFKQIQKHDNQLALHLEQSIKTGVALVYDPAVSVPWAF